MAKETIRIRLKGYDHEIVDQSTKLIVDTAQKTGAKAVSYTHLDVYKRQDRG